MKITLSRWNAGRKLHPSDRFACLYLSDDPTCAQFEAGEQLGFPSPGSYVAHPKRSFAHLTVKVLLRDVIDLSEVTSQTALSTTVQELTGDWKGYDLRSLSTSVSSPVGNAPTQDLGEALFKQKIEGFRATSARLPWHKNLVIFPDNMRLGSSVIYEQNGRVVHSIKGNKP